MKKKAITLNSKLKQRNINKNEYATLAVVSKSKVEFNYSTITRKRSKKAFHYQCFPENLGKRFVKVESLNPRLVLINY